MSYPILLRIPFEDHEYGRFSRIGHTANGRQFMAFVSGAMPRDWWSGKYPPQFIQANWARFKRWYAVLHLFDSTGNHIQTEAWSGGTTYSGQQQAMECADRKLGEMLSSLGPVQFADINVGTFVVEQDGYLFGLIHEVKSRDDPENPEATFESIMLEPNDIMFHPPWNSGEYST